MWEREQQIQEALAREGQAPRGDVGMVCLCILVFFVIMRNLALRKML